MRLSPLPSPLYVYYFYTFIHTRTHAAPDRSRLLIRDALARRVCRGRAMRVEWAAPAVPYGRVAAHRGLDRAAVFLHRVRHPIGASCKVRAQRVERQTKWWQMVQQLKMEDRV